MHIRESDLRRVFRSTFRNKKKGKPDDFFALISRQQEKADAVLEILQKYGNDLCVNSFIEKCEALIHVSLSMMLLE